MKSEPYKDFLRKNILAGRELNLSVGDRVTFKDKIGFIWYDVVITSANDIRCEISESEGKDPFLSTTWLGLKKAIERYKNV